MDTKSYPTDTAVAFDDWDRTWTKYVGYDFDSLNIKGKHLIEIQMPHAVERWGIVIDVETFLIKVDDAITFPNNPLTYYASSERTASHLIVTLKVDGNEFIDGMCVYHEARPGLVFTLSTQLLEACKIS